MKILGLDISSSKIGIALLDSDEIVISEVLKFKTSMSLEERAEIFEQRMRQINEQHVVYDVFVEQPAMMFKGGKTTAFTMATLQRFNGMCCYVVNIVFEMEAELINPLSARSALDIKVPRGIPSKEKKRVLIEWVKERFDEDFATSLTRHGNYSPGVDDRADAVIVALAGSILLDEE